MLRHGSRLHRFRPPLLFFHSLLAILRRAHQRECPSATALIAYGRQRYRCALRSHRHPNRHRICQSLSGCLATGELPGCGHQQASKVSDQQLCSSGTDYSPNLQMPVASGTLFDGSNSICESSPFRYQRQRSEDSDLDCDLDLRARGHRTLALGPTGESLPNPTDSQRHAFRESARFTGSKHLPSTTTYSRTPTS